MTLPLSEEIHIAYFITPHGFGHAARACAIMAAMTSADPNIHFEIFTQVPEWFFVASRIGSYTYHDCYSDVGLAQMTPLIEDLDLTIQRLNNLLPFRHEMLQDLAARLNRLQCRAVVCDIAPLGIAAARMAGLPSILTENFTWDWIYQGYVRDEPRFAEFIAYLHNIFGSANYLIQTAPMCVSTPDSILTTRPVSRNPHTAASQVRSQLGIPAGAKVVLISMGGIPDDYPFTQKLASIPDIFFIVPGAGQTVQKERNRVILPHHSNFYHPDLMAASDMVVGKAGYSTCAEAYWAGIPFAYIPRQKFLESAVMAQFIHSSVGGFEIMDSDFQAGNWTERLPEWLEKPKLFRQPPNGAEQAGRLICDLVR